MKNAPDNSMDVIDSKDIIERIEELQAEKEALQEAVEEAGEGIEEEDKITAETALEDWEKENGEELKALENLNEEGEGYGDWAHGETLIADSYFTQYAQELAYDIGAVDRNANWPLQHIDWEAAAEELKSDYACISFDGVDYWMRA
jgi:hypothetical protein